MQLTNLGIKEPRDWYNVSLTQLSKSGALGILTYYYNGSLIKALQSIYPEHGWHPYRFSKPHNVPQGSISFSKKQYMLLKHLQQLFPVGTEMLFNHNYSSHRDAVGKSTTLNFDVSSCHPSSIHRFKIFIPTLSLAFEYNGEYHYHYVPMYLVTPLHAITSMT